ncbi:alpha/beta hydrolase [Gorillibacterium sp. CAU 1737]|uniref:alpha/beta fold hydrolase n=1 Tax=Gorillibacterium sp. CAU 1737 TaxID=3140362 RepID=UPI00325FFDE5
MNEGYVEVSQGRIFYRSTGQGEPIVLIHGNFNDHHIWDEQVDPLSSLAQVICYDLRGYGLSSTPTTAFSHVKDLKALLDHLQVEAVTLIGSSLGGSVAVDFALAYPDRIRRLVLVSPSLSGSRYPTKMIWHGIANALRLRFRGPDKAIEAFIHSPFWQYFFPSVHKEEARRKVLANVRNPRNFYRFPLSISGAEKKPALPRLHELDSPTLILISDQDHPYNQKTADTLHRQIHGSALAVFPGCGHLPFVEEPEEFQKQVLGFLRKEGTR